MIGTDQRGGGLYVAVQFLTRIPIRSADPGNDLTRASVWFPTVGLLVAAVVVAARAAAEPAVGAGAATVTGVLAGIVLTGALHEDGLADTADALWGGATRERRLEIMRDSRLGTYGVIALVGELALRVTLLAGVELADFARAAVVAHVVGRAAALLLAAWLPPARPDSQAVRAGRPSIGGWLVVGTTAVGTVVVATGPWAPVILAAAALVAVGVGLLARAKVGGITGDVLGAAVTVTALVTAAVVVALARAGVG